MALKDLNEELYKRDGFEREPERPHQFDAGVDGAASGTSEEAYRQSDGWNARPQSFMERNRQAIIRGSIIFGIIVAVALTYFVFVRIQQSAFNSDRVTMKTDGPTEVSGSQASLFVFSYSNINRSDLTDAELTFTYPENFRPDPMENLSISGSSSQMHVGTIAGHSQGKVELRGKFIGSRGSVAYIKGVLRYKPESVGSFFQTESQIGVTIQSASIKLSMEAPLEVASGGVVEYRVDYTNMSDVRFDNMRLKADYPDGFHPTETTPKASEGDSVWYLGNLMPNQSGSVRIVGTMDGAKNEAKIIKTHIGMMQGNGELLSYSDGERLTKIVASPFFIQQVANGLNKLNVNPGTALRYDINYKNDGEVGLRNAIITLEVQGDALDYSRMQPDGGSFDAARKIITWKAGDIHALANLGPGQGGTVSFSVPVLNTIPTKTDADKNFMITSIAKIDSPDVPTPTGSNKIVGSNTLRIKVNSAINVGVVASTQDGADWNKGPVPPVLGQETTYAIHWTASNTTNDIGKAIVTAYLPTGVKWTGKVAPSSENVAYNERTNQITWTAGNIQGGTGTGNKPPREVVFQVSLTPQLNQVGQLTPILGETSFTAQDLFTEENLQSKQQQQTINISQ